MHLRYEAFIPHLQKLPNFWIPRDKQANITELAETLIIKRTADRFTLSERPRLFASAISRDARVSSKHRSEMHTEASVHVNEDDSKSLSAPYRFRRVEWLHGCDLRNQRVGGLPRAERTSDAYGKAKRRAGRELGNK